MTKKRSTKTALLMSVLSLFLCFSMLLGTTYAWFTDSVSSANNIITAGNLDVVLEYKTDWNDEWAPVEADTLLFNEDALYEPGYTEIVFLRVSNAGSLALKYNLMFNLTDEVAGTNVYGEEYKLSDYLQFGSYYQDEYSTGFNYADILMPGMFGTREAALQNANMVTLSKADPMLATNAPVLVGDKTAQVFALVLSMPTTVGNEANPMPGTQAPSFKLGVSLVATQMIAENDSFGNEYDKDANPVFVSDAAELEAALTAEDVRDIVLTKDVTLAKAVKVTTDKVIDFNGKNFTAESGSRPFQVYGADITINAIGSKVEMDTYGLIDIREGADVKVSITGGTFTGELDNGSVIKGRAGTKAEIYLKDVNMTFTDKSTGSTNGSYIYNPVKGASATTTIDGGVYNIDCGVIGDIVIKNATINAKGFIFNGGGSIENSVLTTDGSSKAPFGDAPFCCVAVSGNRTATVTGSTLTATNCNAIEVYPTGGVVTVVDSTVTGACYKHPLYDANDKCSITINGVEQ